MDKTLHKYILRNNYSLSWEERRENVRQALNGFIYAQSKNYPDWDISYNNILVRVYDDNTVIVKISDFRLVKTADSSLKSCNTGIKGDFNDSKLVNDRFVNYDKYHEIYVITLIVYFIFTGRTNVEVDNNESISKFSDRSMNPVRTKRCSFTEEVL